MGENINKNRVLMIVIFCLTFSKIAEKLSYSQWVFEIGFFEKGDT